MMRRMRYLLSLLCLATLAGTLHAQRERLSPEDLTIIQQKYPTAKRTTSGLRYVITEPGTGEPARHGDQVSVLYKGMLIDGKVFNEATKREEPFTFRLGRGQVIEGWDQGLRLMREGGKMTLIVPYELGYGTRGNPPMVPRQATLVFEIEMLKIERAEPPKSHLPPPPKPQEVKPPQKR